MNDYIQSEFKMTPASDDAADLLASYLSDAGYESFVSTPDGLQAFIPRSVFDPAELSAILDGFPMAVKFEYTNSIIEGRDWNEEWERNYFQPIVIGNRCVVHSTFHKNVPAAEIDITVDPRMAFGTGHHATTSMMMRHLLDAPVKGAAVTDMGTGTGILAILAAKLGAADVAGIEIDPMAADNAADNCDLNEVDVRIITGDSGSLQGLRPSDIFLANINRNVILADLDRYVDSMKEGSCLYLSGFLLRDIAMLKNAAERCGLELSATMADGEWASAQFYKPRREML